MRSSKYRLLLASIMALSIPYTAFSQTVTSDYFSIQQANWDNIEIGKSKYTPISILAEADKYYKEINKYLFDITPPPLEKKIDITIVPKKQSGNGNWTSGKHIYLNAGNIETNYIPLAHEITHVIIFSSSIIGFSEGLADYFQNLLTLEENQFFYYKGNVNEKLRVYWENCFDKDNLDKTMNGFLSHTFYLENESLVKYLIDRFGVKAFLEYFNGDGFKTYLEVYGFSQEEIEVDWYNQVMNSKEDVFWKQYWCELSHFFE